MTNSSLFVHGNGTSRVVTHRKQFALVESSRDPVLRERSPADRPAQYGGQALRGLLILAICCGHNRLITGSIKESFYLLYFWHVQAFFFIAFHERITKGRFLPEGTVFVRYMTPFVMIVGAISLARSAVLLDPVYLYQFGMGTLTGYAPAIKEACGFYLFWFLPTFVAFSIFALWQSRGGLWRWTAFAIVAGSYLGAVTMDKAAVARLGSILPLGVLLAGYLIPSAWLYVRAMGAIDRGGRAGVLVALGSVSSFVLASVWVIGGAMHVNVSMYIFGATPLDAVLASFASVMGCVTITLLSRPLAANRTLRFLGQRSMYVFIFHQLVQAPLLVVTGKLLERLGPLGEGRPTMFVAGTAVLIVAVIAALLLSEMFERQPWLKRIVFPVDAAALREAWRSLGRKAAREND